MKSILLIAERNEIAQSFRAILSEDCDVRCVSSEAEGLAALQNADRRFAAVLIELELARRSGFAFSNTMREHAVLSTIPMIAISAALPTPRDAECLEHGFFDLITAYAPAPLVRKRIGNTIRAKDSVTLHELEQMLKQLPACIFLKDAEGKYVFSTQYWHHLNTDSDEEWSIRGKTDLEIRKDRENALKAMEADRRILETGQGTEYIIEENQDGVREYLQLIKRPVYDDQGRVNGIIALINNVTDHQLLKMELEKRAKTDQLTGLLNKNAAEALIAMLMANYHRAEDRCALLMIDADRFKDINDRFGHAEGDRVLAEIGRVIQNNCRSEDVAGRIGGDEFVVFMRKSVTPENVRVLAERLQRQVMTHFEGSALEGHVSLSIGIALFPEHGTRYESLFKAADSALYHVKDHVRGMIRFY